MATKREKVERNITYCREQLERFLERHYKITFRGSVYANKYLYREKRFAKTTFLDKGVVDVDLEYQLLLKGNKEKMLHAILREGVRIANWYTGKSTVDGSSEFEEEVKRHGLPCYGGLSEFGLNLHTYICSECGRIWALKPKKLPPTRDPSQLNLLTGCCKAKFEYSGHIFYENAELQKMKKRVVDKESD